MKYFAVSLIKLYKKYISIFLPPSCRFTPTCSEYAMEAILKYGIIKGGFKSAYRILRCNPWNNGGFDPVDKQSNGTKQSLKEKTEAL